MLILWILIGAGLLFIVQFAVYTRLWDKNVSVSFRFSERAVTEGESAELLERSENRKLLPLPSFGYRYALNRSFTVSSGSDNKRIELRRKFALPARRAVTNRAKIEGLVRGVYSIDDVATYSTDLFHFADLMRPIGFGNSRLIVYPAKIPVREIAPHARMILGSVVTKRKAQEDPFALRSIRPYQIYDSPRTINWKASARTGELKVNEFENTTDEALLLLLDTSGGDDDIEAREELIRVASSLSLFFLRRGVGVSLMANCRDCISGRPVAVRSGADAAHQISIDENLALIKLTIPPAESFRDFLAGIPRETLRRAMPVVLSADRTGEAHKAFMSMDEIRDGIYLSVTTDGEIRTERGITLKNRESEGGGVRL